MIDSVIDVHASQYKLKGGILIYENYDKNQIASIHTCEKNQLMPGRPLNISNLKKMLHMGKSAHTLTFIPEKVLAMSVNSIIWYTSSVKAPIYFKITQQDELNKCNGMEIHWPPMLFIIRENEFFCWALKENRRPCEDTILYHAPFLNIFQEGRICTPSQFRNTGKNLSMRDLISLGEKTFYESFFTHTPGKINYRKGFAKFWVDYCEKCKTRKYKNPFPTRLLVPADKTLKDLLT